MNSLKVRLARKDDLVPLVKLYESVREWLANSGSDQWSTNTVEKMRPRMLESILDGDSYVAEIGGILVGSITIDRFADPEFWSRNDAPEDALYLHRMIVDRQASGKNIGGTLIDWANGIAAREGKRWLRLDAWRTNARLHDYYRSQGFDLVRVVELSHRGSGALFQRGTGVK